MLYNSVSLLPYHHMPQGLNGFFSCYMITNFQLILSLRQCIVIKAWRTCHNNWVAILQTSLFIVFQTFPHHNERIWVSLVIWKCLIHRSNQLHCLCLNQDYQMAWYIVTTIKPGLWFLSKGKQIYGWFQWSHFLRINVLSSTHCIVQALISLLV